MTSIHRRNEVLSSTVIETPLRGSWLATGWNSDTALKILRPLKNATCANDLGSFGEQDCVACEYANGHVFVVLQAFVSKFDGRGIQIVNRLVIPSGSDGSEYCVVSGNTNSVVRNEVGKEPSLIQNTLYQQCKNCPNNDGKQRNNEPVL